MAERVEGFPNPRTRRYPIDEWFDGSVWKIPRDELSSFTSDVSMRAYFSKSAKKYGGKVRVSYQPNVEQYVYVQFTPGKEDQ